MPGRPKGSKNKATILREHAEAQARAQRRMEEDEVPAYFVCAHCGKRFLKQQENFSVCQSTLWAGNNYYLPICNNCLNKLFDHYVETLGNENDACKRICMKFDIYYSQSLLDSTAKHAPNIPRMKAWLRQTNMIQHRGKTFDTYLAEIEGRIINEPEEIIDSKGKVSQRMLEFWGPGFKDQDYVFLDKEYKDWISRYECKTKAQEVLFKNIAIAQLNGMKVAKTGDPKDIKIANDNLQSLLGSANIKPNQTNDNALTDANTFGTLIEKWERTKPIPEPDPAWKDVDGIGHYFRVWVLGTLCEMFNLKNPYKAEYDAEMEKYTAHKPEYHMDEDESSTAAIRNAVFGEAE